MELSELITWLLSQKEGAIESVEDPKTLARVITIMCRAWAPSLDGKSLRFARFGITINNPEDLHQALTNLYELVECRKREAATIKAVPV